MSKVKLAIIGNGMVGHRYIEELIDRTAIDSYEITVFCEEPRVAYDRVHLSSYFSHHTADELSLVKQGLYEKHGINVLLGERAINVNREQKLILSNTGREIRYDKLIMVTGPTLGFRLSKVAKTKTVLFTALSKISKPLKQPQNVVKAVLLSAVVF